MTPAPATAPHLPPAPTGPRPGVGGRWLARHLVGLVRPWRVRLVVVAAAVLAAAVLELAPPLIVRHVIDTDLTPGHTGGLATAAGLYLAAVTAVAALTAGYGYLAATVAQHSLAGLRTRLFTHLLALPTRYHDRTPVGDSISRATADIEAIDDLFSSSVATLLGETVRLVTVAAAMTVLSPALTAAAALVTPPLVLITRVLRRRVRDAERDTRIAVAGLNTQLAEDLAGVEVIRAFGRHASFADRFRRALRRWLRAANRSVFYNAFYTPALGVLAAAATALLVWLGAGDTLTSIGVSVGALTAFLLLFARFFTPLVNLGDEWQSVQAALAGAERVFTVLDLPPDHTPRPTTTDPPVIPVAAGVSAMAMRAVSFGYHPRQPVLHEVTLTVAPGEHVALVGRTGAGKSSVLSLLGGLYPPGTGTVRVTGVDPRTLTDTQRRHLLGVVPQTIALFPGTVTANITLGDPHLNSADVARAAHLAGADTFVTALPDDYDTVLADTGHGAGVQLSAGQRQQLAVARALVTRPRVLLLDEATATIDGASDAAFRAALRHRVLPSGTAVLSIAHRLATARQADRVIIMAAGRILEHGPPDQLRATGGRFAELLTLEEAGWDWHHDPTYRS
jgi:ABC-type multidrug transport system fused ATPase/permease subunit